MAYKNDPSYLWLKGRIFEEQPPKYFFANPKTDQAKLFLSQILDH
jgi:ABC-type polar amino acid transport system ATPase subunit